MIYPGTCPLRATRTTPLDYVIEFRGINLNLATVEMQVRQHPDNPGAAELTLTDLGAGVTGIRVISTDTVDGEARSRVHVFIEEDDLDGLPAAAEVGDDLTWHYDILITPNAGVKGRYLAGPFIIGSAVTRTATTGGGAGGSGVDVIATLQNQSIIVTIDGSQILSALIADAETAAEAANDAADDATAQAAAARAARREALAAAMVSGTLPRGFIDPVEYGIDDYSNDYNVKFYSTGASVWPMIPVVDAYWEWLEGDITARLGGVTYVSISVPKKHDPTRQGTAFNTYYVDYATGVDSGAGTSLMSPWKKLTYAMTTATRPALIIADQDWIGTDSFPPQGYSDPGNIRILGNSSTGRPTWVLQIRESVTKAGFAWTDNGDGSWTSVAAMNDAIKNSPGNFDLSQLDAEGAPMVMAKVANKAASQAAPNSFAYENIGAPNANRITVHLLSGEEPDPGVNWAYLEQTGVALPHTFLMDDGDSAVLENLYFVTNVAGVNAPCIAGRALSVTIPGPRVVKTGQFWTIDCGGFGGSGNGLQFFDIARGGCDNFVTKYCRDDGVNAHTFYTYANVNTGDKTLEGRHIHIWHFGGVCEFLGDNGLASQIALNHSSNASTCHDQCRMTRLNVSGGYTDGSVFADVNGAQTLTINCNPHDPEITAGGAVPRVDYWCDGDGLAGVPAKQRILFSGGRVDSTGSTFGATAGGIIEYAMHRGDVSVLAGQTGTVTDVGP